MAFKTFTAGSVLTAADVNDYLMEQAVITCTSGTRPSSPNEGMTIFETDTDKMMIYDGAAWTEVGIIGTSLPRCSATRSTTQSIANNTSDVQVSWTVQNYDVGAMFAATSTTLATIPTGKGGLYLVSTAIEFDTNATGYRQLYLDKNGSTQTRQTINAVSGNPTRVESTTVMNCAAGDTISIGVFQNSGVSLNINSSGAMPLGVVHYLSPTP